MTLAIITRHFPDYAVIGVGLLVLLFASTLRFDHLVTLTVFVLSLTEIDIPDYFVLSWYTRLITRLARWFLFMAIALKGIGAVLQARGSDYPPHPIRRITFVILVLAFTSTVYSIDRQVTVAASMILTLVLLCAFVFLWRVVDDELELSRFVHGVYRAISPLIVVSILFMFRSEYHFLEGRYGGIFRNANGLGLISAVLFPVAVWELRHAKTPGRRFLVYVTILCILLGVLVSKSRSSMIGILLSGSILLLYRYRLGFAAFCVVALSFFLLFIAVGGIYDLDPQTQKKFEAFVRMDSLDDIGGRKERWETAWRYIRKRPALGYGYGTSRFVTRGGLGASVWHQAAGIQGLDFHSSHIQAALELGVVGLIALEILLITILWTGFSLFRNMRTESLPLLGFALFASLLVMIADSFVHGWLFSPGSGMSFMFWLYTALVTRTAVITARRRAEGTLSRPTPGTEPTT